MPKFHSLEQPQPEEVEKITKELREHPEAKPRLTFSFPLNENRETALEMIESESVDQEKVIELLESRDFVEKQAGVYLLNKIPKLSGEVSEKALPILERMSQDKDWYVKQAAAQGLGQMGEKALPILERMSQDKEDLELRQAAAQARVKIIVETKGEKALPILERMSQGKDWYVKQAAAQGLGQMGEKALPILKRMGHQDEDWQVRLRQAAAQARVKIIVETKGEKALPILKRMGRDQDEDWRVREAAIQALGNLGEKALPILERMSQDKDWIVREAAIQGLGQTKRPKFHSWLLATRKPLFAVPETKELAEKIIKLEEIAKQLKKKFKDDFIGITIFGSTAKGYSEKGSDLDWGIIAKNKEVSEYFKKLAESLRLCAEHYVGVDKNYQTVSSQEIPFYGLFFGDHQQLRKLQKTILKNGECKWDEIRGKIRDNETSLDKASVRYNLTDDEVAKIKQFVSLLRVPPGYQETLRILQARG